jgi:hypothetical protein
MVIVAGRHTDFPLLMMNLAMPAGPFARGE